MKINILEDDELRKEVRELIKGQVKHLMRNERDIQDIIADVLKELMPLKTMIRTYLKEEINKLLWDEKWGHFGQLRKVLTKEIRKQIKDILANLIEKEYNLKVTLMEKENE